MTISGLPPGFEGFGFETDETQRDPDPVTAAISHLRESPRYISAESVLKPELVSKLDDKAVRYLRENRVWAIAARDRKQAESVSKQGFKALKGKRMVDAATPHLHNLRLIVAYPGGSIVSDPPQAPEPKQKVSDQKYKLLQKAKAVFGEKGAKLSGGEGNYTLWIGPGKKSLVGRFSPGTVSRPTLEQIEAALDSAIAQVTKENPSHSNCPNCGERIDWSSPHLRIFDSEVFCNYECAANYRTANEEEGPIFRTSKPANTNPVPNPVWSCFIRGEYWIHPDGGSEFADIDIGESGHEAIALDNMLDLDRLVAGLVSYYENQDEEYKEQYNTDDDIDRINSYESVAAIYLNEYIPDQIGIASVDAPASKREKIWRDIRDDARTAYAKHKGAIQVVDVNFYVWKLTKKHLDQIIDFLYEQLGDEDGFVASKDEKIWIEEGETKRTASITLSELMSIKNAFQLWSRKVARDNPTKTDQMKRRFYIKYLKSEVKAGKVYMAKNVRGETMSVGPYHRAVGPMQYAIYVGNRSVETSSLSDIVASFIATAVPGTIISLKAYHEA